MTKEHLRVIRVAQIKLLHESPKLEVILLHKHIQLLFGIQPAWVSFQSPQLSLYYYKIT